MTEQKLAGKIAAIGAYDSGKLYNLLRQTPKELIKGKVTDEILHFIRRGYLDDSDRRSFLRDILKNPTPKNVDAVLDFLINESKWLSDKYFVLLNIISPDYTVAKFNMLLKKLLAKDKNDKITTEFIKKLSNFHYDYSGYLDEEKILKLRKSLATDKSMDKTYESLFNKMLLNQELDLSKIQLIASIHPTEKIIHRLLNLKESLFIDLPKMEEYERIETYNSICEVENSLHKQEYIKTTLKEKYPDLEFEAALIKESLRVVQSGSKREQQQFNNFLLSEGETVLLNDIDEKVCDYLVDHFTQENLEAVNALRSFYGLRLIIDESEFEDSNLRTVRRMQFDDSISTTDEDSEYYPVQYSQIYRDFITGKRLKYKDKEFKMSDYYDMLDSSKAVQILRDYGYADFIGYLPEALADAKIPPEIAEKFNIKDLQKIVYDYYPYKDVYDEDGDFLFTKRWIELVGGLDSADLPGARETYWQDMVKNKQLVKVIQDDLRRHGISESDIEELFEKAKEYGYPNIGSRRDRVNSVFFQLHHVLGLKDGGLNLPRNYAPVVRYPLDTYSGDGVAFSSHFPLHRLDTPLDIFYKKESEVAPHEIMITKEQQPNTKVVRLRTVFIDDDNPHKKVLYYGGARSCSRHSGRLHGMENIMARAKALGDKQKLADAKTKLLVQIVFQNYLELQKRVTERKQEKRRKIEQNKVKTQKKKSVRKNSKDNQAKR